MQRQEELAFIKTLSTLQISLALLKELRTALASSKKKKTLGSAGSRGTTLRPSSLNTGKRKANELVSSGGTTEPAGQWSATLESLDPEDQSLWKITKRVMRVPPLPPLVTPGGIAVSDSEKAEALADTLETQFQPVADPSVLAVIETADVALKSYFQAPASEPKLTNPDEVHEAIRGLKVGKAPGPNGIPNRALKHLPQRAVYLLVQIFNAFLLTHHFPSLWKHARVISNLKPGKDPELPSFHRPINSLDVIGKLFEKI
jgi:hypothetical protein